MPLDFSALMSLTDDGNRLSEILEPLLNRNQYSTAGAIDPFSDINAYKVNPSRGVLMQEGGIVPGGGDPTFPSFALGKSYEVVPSRAEVIAESLGMDVENFRRFRNAVAWHESAHTLDTRIKQIGGGPGRGLFQFEPDAAKDAAVRLEALYKKEGVPAPDFVYRFLDKKNTSPDASTLTVHEQEELLLGQMIHLDKQKNPKLYKAFTKDLDNETLKDAWFTYHNKSSSDKTEDRKTSFDNSITYLKSNNFDLSDINIFDVSTDDNNYRYATEMAGQPFDPANLLKGADNLTKYGTPVQHLTNLPVKSSKLVNKIPMDTSKSGGMMLNSPVNAFGYTTQGVPPRAQMGGDIMGQQPMMFSPEPQQRELGMLPQFPQDMYPYQRPALPMEIALPMMYYGGEVDKAFLGKLVKGAWKGVKGLGKGIFDLGKAKIDWGLGLVGAPDLIKNSWVDKSKFLSKANNIVGGVARGIADVVIPGSGTIAGMIGGAINPKQQAEASQMPQMGFDPSQFGYDPSQMGYDPGVSDMGMPQSGMGFNPLSMFGGQGNMTGGFMGGNPMMGMQMGNPFGGGGGAMNLIGGLLGGQGGGQGNGLGGLLSGLLGGGQGGGGGIGALLGGLLGGNRMYGGRIYKNGGWVIPTAPLQGIQTESFKGVPERIIFPDANIGKVNATTTHEKMGEDTITDFIQEGSYVASSRPNMAFTREELFNIVLGYKNKTYKTDEVVGVPEVITAADILKKGEKKIVPSMYADRIAKTYPTVENHDDDIFNKAANQYNVEARVPYINVLHQLGERNKQVAEFRNGGFSYGVPQANFGAFLKGALPFAGDVLGGLLGSRGGGGGSQARLDPMNSAMMLGSFPMSAIGINQNIRSQRQALDRGMSELDTLTADQRQLNQAGVGVGAMSTLMQETNLPDINMDFSRLQNFRTQTPQSFIDAAAAPVTDYRSLMDRLGGRAAVSAMANSEAASMQARNQAASDAFGRDREMQFNIENQITQGMNQQEVMNNQIAQQEMAMRNNVIGNLGSQVQGGLQNEGTIMASAFQNRRMMDMQRSMLAGQANMANAQNLMNLGSTRQSLMSSMAPPQQQMAQPQSSFQYSRASQPPVASRDDIMGMLNQATRTATAPTFTPPNINTIASQLGRMGQFNPSFNQNVGLNPNMGGIPIGGLFGRGG